MIQPVSKFNFNFDAYQKALALVRSGNYTSKAWSFTVDDANALLDMDPDSPGSGNWIAYANWFLGEANNKPDPVSDVDITPEKAWWAYVYGKEGMVFLGALRQIITDSQAAGDGAITQAAQQLLTMAEAKDADNEALPPAPAVASSSARRQISFPAEFNLLGAETGKKTPTFHMVAYTGGPMRLEGWTHPVVIDLEGMQGLDTSIPILRDHDGSQIAGHTTNLEVTTDHQLLADGVMSAAGFPTADEIITAGKNGFPWQASVGASTLDNEFIPAGQSAQANGRTWPGPVNIARQTKLGEISFVPRGADSSTSARIAAALPR